MKQLPKAASIKPPYRHAIISFSRGTHEEEGGGRFIEVGLILKGPQLPPCTVGNHPCAERE